MLYIPFYPGITRTQEYVTGITGRIMSCVFVWYAKSRAAHSILNNNVSTMRLHNVQQTGTMYASSFNVSQIGCFNLHASWNPNLKGTVFYDWTQMMQKFQPKKTCTANS